MKSLRLMVQEICEKQNFVVVPWGASTPQIPSKHNFTLKTLLPRGFDLAEHVVSTWSKPRSDHGYFVQKLPRVKNAAYATL